MISHLRGRIDSVQGEQVVLDISGIGFSMRVPASFAAGLEVGEQRLVPTQMVVRQDDVSLFGFATNYERELFNLLVTISGVGPKLALKILSGLPPHELAEAVIGEDLKALTAIPGVGPKTARRILVEISEKIAGLAPEATTSPRKARGAGDVLREAEQVLRSLGCSLEEAEAALAAAGDDGAEQSVDRLVMAAMRYLGQGLAEASAC